MVSILQRSREPLTYLSPHPTCLVLREIQHSFSTLVLLSSETFAVPPSFLDVIIGYYRSLSLFLPLATPI